MDQCSMKHERVTSNVSPCTGYRLVAPTPCPQGRDTSIESSDFRSGGCGGTSTSRAEIRGEEQKRVLFKSIRSHFAPALRKVNGAISVA